MTDKEISPEDFKDLVKTGIETGGKILAERPEAWDYLALFGGISAIGLSHYISHPIKNVIRAGGTGGMAFGAGSLTARHIDGVGEAVFGGAALGLGAWEIKNALDQHAREIGATAPVRIPTAPTGPGSVPTVLSWGFVPFPGGF